MGNFTSQWFQKWFGISPNAKIDGVILFWKSEFFPYKILLNEILYGKNSLFQIALVPSIFELGEIQTHIRNPWELSFPIKYSKNDYF